MKKNKRLLAVGLLCFTLWGVAGCGNVDQLKHDEDQKSTNKNTTTATGRVDKGSYQSIIENGKYKTSPTRGYSASRLNSNYNLNNFETGLLNLSKEHFSVDRFYFQEGQKISEKHLKQWLGRKSDSNPNGLNPENEAEPIILQQILEQDFIDVENHKLEGMSIGLALNKVYYTQDDSVEIPEEKVESEGKRIADELLAKLREIKGLAAIPITINLFEQAPREDIAGGRYIAQGISENGDTSIKDWKPINEEYILLPIVDDEVNTATEDGLSGKFNDFRNNVQGFFPNLSGVTGVAYYKDKALQTLSIKIETKYFGKTEMTSFTQYVGKSVETIFHLPANIEVQINSIEGPQAFVEKAADSDTVYSHVFD